jgi:hypothetical protein
MMRSEIVSYSRLDFPSGHFSMGEIDLFLEKAIGAKKELDQSAGQSKKPVYLNHICAFGIKTSSFICERKKSATMYVWHFGMNGYVIMGREWIEFDAFCSRLKKELKINEKRRLGVFVHDLSQEFQFMRKLFLFKNVLAENKLYPITARESGGIEFRCSCVLSGCDISETGKLLTRHDIKKPEGDLNRLLVRHCKTPLTEQEMAHCEYDVRVVMAYIDELLEDNGNGLPLAKMGFVRRAYRNACMSYQEDLGKLELYNMSYNLTRLSIAGGLARSNVLHENKRLENVASWVINSSYPACIALEGYPGLYLEDSYYQMGFGKAMAGKDIASNRPLMELLKGKCCLLSISFAYLEKIDGAPVPYLSANRCFLEGRCLAECGIVKKAEKLMIVCTNVDFEMILAGYSFKSILFKEFCCFEKEYLPRALVQEMLTSYQNMVCLKEQPESRPEYEKAKANVNLLYKMMSTDFLKDAVEYDYHYHYNGWFDKKVEKLKKLQEYRGSKSRFLFYPWGAFVSAYARRNLREAMIGIGDDCVCADTDSVKFLNPEAHVKLFSDLNSNTEKKIIRASRTQDIPISLFKPKTASGDSKPIGFWEFEWVAEQFKTLGAKKSLAIIGGKAQLSVPVGEKANKYVEQQEDPLEFFTDGMQIPSEHSGCTALTYIHQMSCGAVTDYLGETEQWFELSSVHREPEAYTLAIDLFYVDPAKLFDFIQTDAFFGADELVW